MKKKLFILLVLMALSSVSYVSFSQNFSITLRNVTAKEAIRKLKAVSGYNIVYEVSDLNSSSRISVDLKNRPLSEIVGEILKNQHVDFQIKGNNIIITSKDLSLRPTAPSKKITGTITDKHGIPLIGAMVRDSESGTTTFTDLYGFFSLETQKGNYISATYPGFITYNSRVTNQHGFTIMLDEKFIQLEDVVVVGYGIQKKETMVGAVSTLEGKQLEQSTLRNITNTLSGKLSGVLTMQQSGEPGNDYSEIIVRGISSWNGTSPIVLVDGVERDFKDLDPSDINSISVLKDASATAVFGAKGANGVILVTTKRGVVGKPKLEINYSSGISFATRTNPFVDAYTTMSVLNIAAMNTMQYELITPEHTLREYRNPSTPLHSIQYPNVDWYSLLTKSVAKTNYANFNLNGGSESLKYFVSAGWYNQGSMLDMTRQSELDMNNRFNRFTFRANVDVSLTETTGLLMNVGGIVGIKNQLNSQIWESIYTASPSRFPAFYPDWMLKEIPDRNYPYDKGLRYASSFGDFMGNPYYLVNNSSHSQYKSSTLFTDIALTQKLDFLLKGLSVTGKASLSTYYQNNTLTVTRPSPQFDFNFDAIHSQNVNPWTMNLANNEIYVEPPIDVSTPGTLIDNYYSDLYLELGMNYKRSFGGHNVTGLILGNRKQRNNSIEFPFYNQSLVSRVTYDYLRKYLTEINIGITGSEQFAPENRYGFFPSAAVGWVVSEEDFFNENIAWIDKLKLRFSSGYVGSDNAVSRWLYISEYIIQNNLIYEDKIGNAVAQWERALKQDLGIEFGFLRNNLRVNIDLFREYRDKMLLTPQNITMLVGNSIKDLNIGSMKKHGIELDMEYYKRISKSLNINFKGIFGITENRVLYKDDLLYNPEYMQEAGKPMDAQLRGVSLSDNGYFRTVDDIHNNPSPININNLVIGDYKYIDYNADGKITNLDRYPIYGSYYPPVTYSFSAGLNYKKFEFAFMFQGNAGKYVMYNNNFEVEFNQGIYRLHSSQLDFWRPDNQNVNHSTPHYTSSVNYPNLSWAGGDAYNGYSMMLENKFWRRADYFRLKELYASYKFESAKMQKEIGIKSILFYVSANNLITWTPLMEGDPERRNFTYGFSPLRASINTGIKMGF